MKTFERLSGLEQLLLKEAFRRYECFGFPALSSISVINRSQTEASRRTSIFHEGLVGIADGPIVLAQVELPVLGLLLLAELEIETGKVKALEIVVAGDDIWGGDEPKPYDLYV